MTARGPLARPLVGSRPLVGPLAAAVLALGAAPALAQTAQPPATVNDGVNKVAPQARPGDSGAASGNSSVAPSGSSSAASTSGGASGPSANETGAAGRPITAPRAPGAAGAAQTGNAQTTGPSGNNPALGDAGTGRNATGPGAGGAVPSTADVSAPASNAPASSGPVGGTTSSGVAERPKENRTETRADDKAAGAASPAPAVANAPAATGSVAAGTILATLAPGQTTVSSLMGKTVYGAGNETLGEVNDVVLDERGGAVAVVIGVGGFLGIGEKNVAVPYAAVRTVQREGRDLITAAMTKADLSNAPNFARLTSSATATGGGAGAPATGAKP